MIDPQLLRKDIATVAARLAARKFQLDVEKFNALESVFANPYRRITSKAQSII